MADQHNQNIPAVGNTIAADIPDIKENLEFHKDAFEAICSGWSDTDATGLHVNDIKLANNAYAIAFDAAGTGTVSLIKANASDQVELGAVTVTPGLVINSIAQGKDVTAAIHRKIVNIGDWNMDSTANVDVAHGLTLSKIRMVSIMIIRDTDAVLFPFPLGTSTGDYFFVDGTNVGLYRSANGTFDNSNFDATGANRGYIVLEYVD